ERRAARPLARRRHRRRRRPRARARPVARRGRGGHGMTAAAVISMPGTRTGRSLGWWGTVCLIATEAMIFALLLFGWFYLWAISPHWPLGHTADPELL